MNLIALLSRLSTIWRMRTGSPRSSSVTGSTRSIAKRRPLRCAVATWKSVIALINWRKRNGTCSMISLPASIFEKSRMSFHDRLHVLGAVAGEIEVATLGFVEPALVEQVEQAEKPGKQCAQFVAHVREEFALRVAGRFGAGALLLQLDFGGLALADVPRRSTPRHGRYLPGRSP